MTPHNSETYNSETYNTVNSQYNNIIPFKVVGNIVYVNPHVLINSGELIDSYVCNNIADILMGFMIQSYSVRFDFTPSQYLNLDNILYFLQTTEPYFTNIFKEIAEGKLTDDPMFNVISSFEIYDSFRYRVLDFINNSLNSIEMNQVPSHDINRSAPSPEPESSPEPSAKRQCVRN